jgi:hypothetical protein
MANLILEQYAGSPVDSSLDLQVDESDLSGEGSAGGNTAQSAGDGGIVCALSNEGYTRSSDLHEWRNDLGTVSTRDSAKLQYE